MAHEIDTVSIGRASYASTQREWHGLGERMAPGQSIEEWQVAAGMQYEVKRAFVRYATQRDQAESDMRKIDDKVVLFRNDTGADLGIVSANYKVVQPREVLAFFREWAELGGLTIESAGVLFGGKRYFATAKLAEGVALDADGQDKLVPYALLSTSADGSLATECRWTTVRTVCNNTLGLARANSAASYKTSHRSVFVPGVARAAVESAHEEFGAFMETARQLTQLRLSVSNARSLTESLLAEKSNTVEQVQQSAAFNKIVALFNGQGKGSALATAQGTEWGWLNAVTEYADHEARARSTENRQAAALWGAGEVLKQKAVALIAQ